MRALRARILLRRRMSGPQPDFGRLWRRGAGPAPQVVDVRQPRSFRGLRLVGCRAYTWGPTVGRAEALTYTKTKAFGLVTIKWLDPSVLMRIVVCLCVVASLVYDFFVVDGANRILAFVPHGDRQLAAVNFRGERHSVHRLVAILFLPNRNDARIQFLLVQYLCCKKQDCSVAYNTAGPPGAQRQWGNPRRLPWRGTEVHHHPDALRPRRAPWADCRRRAMVVWTAAEHRAWHRARPRVPR